MTKAWRGVIEEYRDRLPVTADTPVVTLLEGGTPLLPAPRLSELTGCEVHLKVEGANPTGSFKDRGMTLAITKAAEEGAKVVICASTGNTSASAAAYAVRAGMVCAVLVPAGQDRDGQAGAGARARRPAPAGRRQLRRLPRTRAQARHRLPGRAGQLGEPLPARRAEDRRVRDRRHARRRTGRALPSRRQRRQHLRLLDGLPGVPHASAHARLPGRRRRADRPWRAGRRAADHRHRDPHRASGLLGPRRTGSRRVRRRDRGGDRPADPRRLPSPLP